MIASHVVLACMLVSESEPSSGVEPGQYGKYVQLMNDAKAELVPIKTLRQWDGLAGKGPELPTGAMPSSGRVVLTGAAQWFDGGCKGDFARLEIEVAPADASFLNVPNHVGEKAHCVPNQFCEVTAQTVVPLTLGAQQLKWQGRMHLSFQWQNCNLRRCVCANRIDTYRTPWKEFSPGEVAFRTPQVYANTTAPLQDFLTTSGRLMSGSPDDLKADDGRPWALRGTGSPRNSAFEFNASLESTDVDGLRIDVTSRSSLQCTQRIEVKTIDDRWVVIDEQDLGSESRALRKLIPPVPLAEIIRPSGLLFRGTTLQFRISCGRTNNLAHTYEIDHVAVEYGRGVFF